MSSVFRLSKPVILIVITEPEIATLAPSEFAAVVNTGVPVHVPLVSVM